MEKKDRLSRIASKLPGIGIIMGAISGCCFATSGFGAEMLQTYSNIQPCVTVAYWSVIQFVIYSAICVRSEMSIWSVREERHLCVIRSISGYLSFVLCFYAYLFMNFADACTIVMSSPIFVAPIAAIFLKERLTVFNMVAIVVTIVGVVLITRPEFIFGNIQGLEFSAASYLIGK